MSKASDIKLSTYIPHDLEFSSNGKRKLSYPFLQENAFTLLRPPKQKEGLLRGPRRVLRLILFGLILPAVLISVPLYVRLILYPPHHYSMNPTDQRLLHRQTSGIWCQAQTARMNGSFNAYLMPDKAHISNSRRRHEMLENLSLKDDVKEYWGFHLLKGSTVTISTCTKWDGGQLMILRGVENLRRCAWIGEEDSLEEIEELPFYSDDTKPEVVTIAPGHEIELPKQAISQERKEGMKMLLSEVLKLSKSKKEILKLLHTEGRAKHYSMDIEEIKKRGRMKKARKLMRRRKGSMEDHFPHLSKLFDVSKNNNSTELDATEHNSSDSKGKRIRYADKVSKLTSRNSVEMHSYRNRDRADRLRRSLSDEPEEYDDAAYEEEEYEDGIYDNTVSKENSLDLSSAEFSVGAQLFQRKGLKFEKGIFNQTNKGDGSYEEHRSSYSSSEEALASCEGVIMALPLLSDRRCRNFKRTESNRVSYDIPVSGTYYFVFSSDNEVFTNDMFINITMDRVVYDTNSSNHICFNKTECSLPLSFWSNEEAIIEVPESNWQDSFLLDTVCDPRVSVYLVFIFLVPILILFCALK